MLNSHKVTVDHRVEIPPRGQKALELSAWKKNRYLQLVFFPVETNTLRSVHVARVKHKYFGKHLPFEAFLTNPSPLWLYTKDRGFTESGQVYLGDSPPDWATRLKLGMDATLR